MDYLKCETQIDNSVWYDRDIHRFVWYQIRKMAGSDINLGKILTVDEGMLGVNYSTILLTDEQQRQVTRLINNLRDGLYHSHKFQDLDRKIDDSYDYGKWFKEQAMDSFLYTVPLRDIFYTYPPDLYRKLLRFHCKDELDKETFRGYSIHELIYALGLINPFLVGMILGWKAYIEEDGLNTYIRFDCCGETLYGKHNSVELFKKNDKGEFVKLKDTIHTLLLKHYQEPILKVINSMILPMGINRIIPDESLYYDPTLPELEADTEAVLRSNYYKILTRKYNLNRSRIPSK